MKKSTPFREFLVKRMKELGVTAEHFPDSRATVDRWRSGESTPHFQKVGSIARILQTDPSDIRELLIKSGRNPAHVPLEQRMDANPRLISKEDLEFLLSIVETTGNAVPLQILLSLLDSRHARPTNP